MPTAAPKVAERRPPRFPPPQFPPHKPKPFASTPPAIFPPILGLLGLVLALRQAALVLGLDKGLGAGLVEIAAGAVLALWLFSVIAIKAKALRRLPVLAEDMRPLPGRAGLAAASMGGMAAGAVIAPYAPGLALVLLWASLLAHLVMLGILAVSLLRQPPQARSVNPTLHLSLVGFIVAAPVLARLGWTGSAAAIFWPCLGAAVLIWGAALVDLVRHVPPAPLRPLLAIHVAPAAVLSSAATALGMYGLAAGLAALAVLITLALLAFGRWMVPAGFSPMWGAFTFPLAALASALLVQGGPAAQAGLVVTAAALVAVPWIAYRVLKLWPGGRLAQKTGAAEA
jgi:tellurite resistance protein